MERLQCIGTRSCGRWFPREHFEHGGRGKRGDGTRMLCEECYERYITPSNALKSLLRKRERNCKYVWSMRKQSAEIWKLAGRLTSKTRKTHHVDHEVPLSGENSERPICGLTVPANLRVMPARYNLSKGASFTESDALRVEDEMMYELRERGLARKI